MVCLFLPTPWGYLQGSQAWLPMWVDSGLHAYTAGALAL